MPSLTTSPMSSSQGGVLTERSQMFISLTAVSYDGLFWAGDAYLLGVQALAVLVITVWSMVSTFVLLFIAETVPSFGSILDLVGETLQALNSSNKL